MSVCVHFLARVARMVGSPEHCLAVIGEASGFKRISVSDAVFLVLGSANTQFFAGPKFSVMPCQIAQKRRGVEERDIYL